ncbi:hypothetical protein [Polaribacter sp.]|uniref:hypothetical protein n=1 Tax=Polaribacter sp. TaxID=1920175 RepID=UPI00404789D8
MKREEHLKFCKVCLNREFNYNKGLLCGLTNKLADFENECKNFEKDSEAEDFNFIRKMENTGDYFTGDNFDYRKNISQGVNIMALGVILTIISLYLSDYLGFYFITGGIIIYGFKQHARGMEQEKIFEEEKQKKEKEKN